MALTPAQESQQPQRKVQSQILTATAAASAESEDSAQPNVVLRQFRDEDLPAVLAIFVDGFISHSADDGEYVEGYIKRSLESDLADITDSYLAAGGNFWVVTVANSEEPEVVGMVGLEKKKDGEGELRRMSIKKEFRRFCIGKLMVAELEQWAKANGYKMISLWTRREMTVAHSFYTSVGYEKKSEMPIPEDPKFVIFEFAKQL